MMYLVSFEVEASTPTEAIEKTIHGDYQSLSVQGEDGTQMIRLGNDERDLGVTVAVD